MAQKVLHSEPQLNESFRQSHEAPAQTGMASVIAKNDCIYTDICFYFSFRQFSSGFQLLILNVRVLTHFHFFEPYGHFVFQ